MQDLLIGAVAVFIGVLLGYWLGKVSLQAERGLLQTRMAELEKEKSAQAIETRELQEDKTRLTAEVATEKARVIAEQNKYTLMKTEIETAFGDLAARALSANNKSFLDLAKLELGGQTSEAKQTLEAKELAIKTMLDPLGAALKSLDEQARAMETARFGAYSEVKTLVSEMKDAIPKSLEGLQRETAQLITALRAPKTRGNWGELQLKRCVEYAGMVEYCSFSEQVTARDEEDKLSTPRRRWMHFWTPAVRRMLRRRRFALRLMRRA